MDITRLKKNTGGNIQLVKAILEKISKQLSQSLQQFQDMQGAKDWQGGYELAHKLRSGTGYLYHSELSDVLLRLEEAYKKQDEAVIIELQEKYQAIAKTCSDTIESIKL